MEVKLFLGTTKRLATVLTDEEHTVRSHIAMSIRPAPVDDNSMQLYLDTVFVGRARTDSDADHANAEWLAVLEGSRCGFALDSLLALSAQMAEIDTKQRGQSQSNSGWSFSWPVVARVATNGVMPNLVNLLTVELSRGRGLDIDGLAQHYEVCWYDREDFVRIISENNSKEWFAGREKARADPDITMRLYEIVRSAERAAAGIAEESFDPLAVSPYTGEAKSCLHTLPPLPVSSVRAEGSTRSGDQNASDQPPAITASYVAAWPRQVDVLTEADECANLLSAALWARFVASACQGSNGCPTLDAQEYHLPESNLLDNSQMQITVAGETHDPQDEEDAWRQVDSWSERGEST